MLHEQRAISIISSPLCKPINLVISWYNICCEHGVYIIYFLLLSEITANNSTKEDRKRKNPDDEDVDIADLANKSFESYKSDEDADYEVYTTYTFNLGNVPK